MGEVLGSAEGEERSPSVNGESFSLPSGSENEDNPLKAPLTNNVFNHVDNCDLPDGLKELPPWSPVSRILTFMGLVCLACTLLVVGIVLVAVYLSHSVASRTRQPAFQVLYVVPEPQSQTISVPRRDSSTLTRQVAALRSLMIEYEQATPCPACGQARLLDQQGNCSQNVNFGFDTGSPCIALIFRSEPNFEPLPFSISSVPEEIRTDYKPDIVYVTCSTGHTTDIRFYPLQGFPVSWFPRREQPPPFLMMQFINPPLRRVIAVSCYLWAKNIPKVDSGVPGKITFNLFVD